MTVLQRGFMCGCGTVLPDQRQHIRFVLLCVGQLGGLLTVSRIPKDRLGSGRMTDCTLSVISIMRLLNCWEAV
jgi:hypothetical protein